MAHSIALMTGALGLAPDVLWFPPLIDTVVAISIVYLALENIVMALRKPPQIALPRPGDHDVSALSANAAIFSDSDLKRRWLATFAFGIAHGFAMSFALRPSLQLSGSHPLTAMVSFNLGVELALLLVLTLLVAVFAVMFRYLVGEQTGAIVVSALAGHSAWHWMGDRWELLRKFTFEPPMIDAAFFAASMRWMMLLVIAAGLYWVIFGVLTGRRSDSGATNLQSEI